MAEEKRIVSVEELLAIPDAADLRRTTVIDGVPVTVRALSLADTRALVAAATVDGKLDADLHERKTLALVMVDPGVTEEQAGALQCKRAGFVDAVLGAAWALSAGKGQNGRRSS